MATDYGAAGGGCCRPRPCRRVELASSAMNATDRAIISHLQSDGRLTNAELAERVSLSPSACLRRVRALEAATAGLDEVVECHRMFGDPDYVIRVAVADVEAYERFLIDTFADLPGVARMTSQFAMKTIRAAATLPFRA